MNMIKSVPTSVATCGYPRAEPSNGGAMRFALLLLLVALAGCREVRVQTFKTGVTTSIGQSQLVVLRDARVLHQYGISAPVRFNKEFGVLLLLGPHRETGWAQLIESIRANSERVRIVAFERGPLGGGEPTAQYRTYTLWIVPNSVYRSGSVVDVVTPSGELLTSTTLR